jgi:tetratricopeptide (TPR) repeat protein
VDLADLVNRVRVGAIPANVAEAEVRSYGALEPHEHYIVYSDIQEAARTLRGEDTATIVAIGQVLVTAALVGLENARLGAAVALHVAALTYEAGDYPNATFFSRRAEMAVETQPELEQELFEARQIMSAAHLKASKYDEAEEVARRMLSMPLVERHTKYEITAREMLGSILDAAGKHADATQEFDRALALLGDDARALGIFDAVGKSARAASDRERAIRAFTAGRELALRLGDRASAALFLSEVGITWTAMGEEKRGSEVLITAAREAEAIGDNDAARRWLAPLKAYELTAAEMDRRLPTELLVSAASTLRVKKDVTKAREMALQGIKRAIEMGDREREAEGRNVLGAIYSEESKYVMAAAAVEAAVRIAETIGDKPMMVRFLGNAGRSYMNGGWTEPAEATLKRALALAREMIDTAQTSEFRQAIIGGMASSMSNLALLLLRDERSAELIALGQQARATNTAAWIAAMTEIDLRRDPKLVDSLLIWRGAEARVESAAMTHSGKLVQNMEKQQRARAQFESRSSGRGVSVRAPEIAVDDLAAALDEDECLVDLFLTYMGPIVTAVGPNGTTASTLAVWSEPDLLRFLDQWQSAIAADQHEPERARRGRDGHRRRTRKAVAIPDLLAEIRAKLGNAILAKAREVAPAMKHLIVVPHRETGQLPFWAAADEDPALHISVTHGTNVAVLLRRRQRAKGGCRIAVGDVTGTLDFAQLEIAALPGFTQIPAEREVLLERLPQAEYIHFAGHAVFNAHNPYLSGVTVRGESRLRFLTVLDLLSRGWLPNAYLAVLSACSTGLPRRHPASEFVGLPAALQIVGCRNVIGSLWPVDDRPTYLLMRELYAALSIDGECVSPASALSIARRKLAALTRTEVIERLGDGRYVPDVEHPYTLPQFTCAFQHYGVD